MCGTTESRTQLPLASAAQNGCSCCSPTADQEALTEAVRSSGYVLTGAK